MHLFSYLSDTDCRRAERSQWSTAWNGEGYATCWTYDVCSLACRGFCSSSMTEMVARSREQRLRVCTAYIE